jgi:hypothetical protein
VTDTEILALAQEAQDNGSALALALLEFLTEKKHSTGAIRAMSPYLTVDEGKAVMARGFEKIRQLAAERKAAREKAGKSEGGVLLPPSGLLIPGR